MLVSEMLVYYAHPISLYNTKQEVRDIELLEKLNFQVVNPNSANAEESYKVQGMEYFKDVIKGCQALAFRSFSDGSIPAGIAKEIAYAKEFGLPIFELPSGICRRSLSVEATRETLQELGTR